MNDSERGLLIDITGDGKGKTTGALGTVLRALGRGWQVAILLMIKNNRETGELRYFRKYHPDMIYECCGLGFINRPGDHAAAARTGWTRARELLLNFPGKLLVIDELNGALAAGLLDVHDVIRDLQNRRPGLNVIFTGRNTPPELAAICDLVSDIRCVRHPFDQGIPAREGIDF